MPGAKRRKLGVRSLTRLTLRQQAWLASGHDLLPCHDEAGIEDDAHARALWIRHRDAVMASGFNCNTPGRRPWAFWRYDIGLERDGMTFRWPGRACSEAEVIHRHHADAAERQAIEADWLGAMRVAIGQSYGNPRGDPEGHALSFYGVSRAFYRKHASPILAALEAERATDRHGRSAMSSQEA